VGFEKILERPDPIFVLPEKNFGEHTVAVVSVCPSVHLSSQLLNISSEIEVVGKKCSFKQRHVNQGLSRSFWKVSRSLRAYKRKIQINFFSYKCQRYWHKIFRNRYWVLQAIYAKNKYGSWGQPAPRYGKLLNKSRAIDTPTPKSYTFLFLVLQAIYSVH
jgi:hypothetical protein